MPNDPKKTPNLGPNSLGQRPRQKPVRKRFDPRDLGGKGRSKTRGGRPKLFPGRTGGR